ncbi:MAG TPA: hypothetical protein PKX93_02680, partial [bacterium]|nr:hypothetical protein [bacterium]
MSKRLFLITVDCDLRVDATGLRQETLEQLLAVFDGSGVSGHVTWFLNENDFQLTRYHKSFLDEAIRRGDTLGLHDHLDKMKRPLNKETVKQYCQASKRRVEDFLKKRKVGRKILFHRNGCFLQEATVYAALRELGYTVCSDIYPGMAGLDHHGNIAYDNRLIPEGIRP